MAHPLAIPTSPDVWGTLRASMLDRLTGILEEHGNTLSADHRRALVCLTVAMVNRLEGTERGRLAFGLPTGMGKTSAIRALCAALEPLWPHVGSKTITIAASKVEALCELKRAMIADGVSPERIGLIHSKRFDPRTARKIIEGSYHKDDHASEPSEGHERTILLVTHARVRGQHGELMDYMRRDLLVWDESLFVSDASGVALPKLDAEAGALQRRADYNEQLRSLADYLDTCVAICKAHREKLNETGAPEAVFRFPSLSAENAEDFRRLIGNEYENAGRLLDYANEAIRYIPTKFGGVLSYKVAIPDEIDNIVILDASHPIRELVRSTPDIMDAETDHPLMVGLGVSLSAIKRFDNVALRFMKRPGGRKGMTRDLLQTRRGEVREITRDLIEAVRTIPADEAVLIFTYRKRPNDRRSMSDVILTDLDEAGIDTTATVIDAKGQVRPRFTVLTWGQETSSNSYSYCKHVMLVGILRRAQEDVAAAFVGETRNIRVDIDNDLIASLVRSEAAHCAYQAVSRGACRTAVDGQALPMTAWVMFDDDRLVDTLAEVMPGVTVEPWRSVTGEYKGSKAQGTAATIADYLRSLPADVARVSVRQLKKATALDAIPPQSFRRARDEALKLTPWHLEGGTLVRTF